MPSCASAVPSHVIPLIGVIATTAAVIVALFKDEFWQWWHRPRLSVRLRPEPPDCILVPRTIVSNETQVLWVGKTYWIRLWVENTGSRRAEQVQVFAGALFKRNATGHFVPEGNFVPMNLKWSNASDPQKPEIFAPGISSNFGKHCDLCSVSDPANPTQASWGYPGQCVGTLQLEVVPFGDFHLLPPGDYVLRINVGAANAKPVVTYVRINIKGPWSPDQTTMFKNHLGVEIVPFGFVS